MSENISKADDVEVFQADTEMKPNLMRMSASFDTGPKLPPNLPPSPKKVAIDQKLGQKSTSAKELTTKKDQK